MQSIHLLQARPELAVLGRPFCLPALRQRVPSVHLSLVVPTHNERHNIRELLDRIHLALAARVPRYEIIVVDDDSPDRTWELAEQIARWDKRVRVVHRTHERGLATAVVRGWEIARGEVLGVIDADLQHPPELLRELWSEIEGGADLAVASRHVDGEEVGHSNVFRRIASRGACWLAKTLLLCIVSRVSDPMSGYFLVRRSILVDTNLSPRGYKILIEVLGRARAKNIREVGYVFGRRRHGESKATLAVCWDYLLHLLRLRFDLLVRSRHPHAARKSPCFVILNGSSDGNRGTT